MALQICLRMVVLLAAAGRGDNQATGALAHRRDEVDDPGFNQVGARFELEFFNRVNRREVFKADGLGIFLKRHVVDLVHCLELGAGAAVRRLGRPFHMAALAQETAPDRVGRDKYIRRFGMKMISDGAEESKALFGDFQIAGTVIGRFVTVIIIIIIV